MRPVEIVSLILFVVIFAVVVYFVDQRNSAAIPVVETTPTITVTPVAKEVPVEKIPEPFRYAEAVIPSFVPTPKPRPRPHHRHFPVCKPVVVK